MGPIMQRRRRQSTEAGRGEVRTCGRLYHLRKTSTRKAGMQGPDSSLETVPVPHLLPIRQEPATAGSAARVKQYRTHASGSPTTTPLLTPPADRTGLPLREAAVRVQYRIHASRSPTTTPLLTTTNAPKAATTSARGSSWRTRAPLRSHARRSVPITASRINVTEPTGCCVSYEGCRRRPSATPS